MKTCEICQKEFVHNGAFISHQRIHKRSFDQLTKDSQRRRKLIEIHGHKCWGCGLSEWRNKPIPLTLEHKDGNSDNSKEENLELLCWNCHAQTSTFGSKNAKKHPGTKRQSVYRRIYRGSENVGTRWSVPVSHKDEEVDSISSPTTNGA